MDKRFQLGILDQLAGQSGQVSRFTKHLQQIDGWLDWQPLYQIGRRIDKTGSWPPRACLCPSMFI